MEDTSTTPATQTETEKRTALERAILTNRKVLTSLSTSALLFDVFEISSETDEAKLAAFSGLKAWDECSMVQPKQQSKAILLHLPIELLQAFDKAAKGFELSRCETIRRSLMRDVTYLMETELPKAMEEKQRRLDGYRSWLAERQMQC